MVAKDFQGIFSLEVQRPLKEEGFHDRFFLFVGNTPED